MKSVMIADDVAGIRFLLSQIVQRDEDLDVVAEAADGEEALQAARRLKPDVVLLDLNMPLKSGLEVLPDLRSSLPETAIVVFSGFSDPSLAGSAIDLGADAYVEKGAGPREILTRIHAACSARQRST